MPLPLPFTGAYSSFTSAPNCPRRYTSPPSPPASHTHCGCAAARLGPTGPHTTRETKLRVTRSVRVTGAHYIYCTLDEMYQLKSQNDWQFCITRLFVKFCYNKELLAYHIMVLQYYSSIL